jgi:ABC-type cobalamin/Fe3+-siderophores transport system ATPase subunit
MALVGCALRAGYGGCAVLDGVDFRLEPGQLLCLLGPNGAGKSTLARALCGLLPGSATAAKASSTATADGGPARASQPSSVEVDGDALARLSPRARAQRIGFLPQEIEPSFSFRVSEAVELGARVAASQVPAPAPNSAAASRKSQRGDRQAAVSAALQAVDAEHLADRRLNALSGGERRRVLLASVLAQQPRYLVLDEPTAMLDLEHQVQLFEVLRTRCDAGMGVVVVTHDLNLAAQWADELVLLHCGRIAAQGTPQQVFVRNTLSNVFGSRFQLLETPEGRPVLVPR